MTVSVVRREVAADPLLEGSWKGVRHSLSTEDEAHEKPDAEGEREYPGRRNSRRTLVATVKSGEELLFARRHVEPVRLQSTALVEPDQIVEIGLNVRANARIVTKRDIAAFLMHSADVDQHFEETAVHGYAALTASSVTLRGVMIRRSAPIARTCRAKTAVSFLPSIWAVAFAGSDMKKRRMRTSC